MNLSKILNVNVISYDYSGYGESTGTSVVDAITLIMESGLQESSKLYSKSLEDLATNIKFFWHAFQERPMKRIVMRISKRSLNT